MLGAATRIYVDAEGRDRKKWPGLVDRRTDARWLRERFSVSRRVTRVVDEVIALRGLPQAIRCDNGPELTSRHFLAWALEWKIELRHIQPGRPMQNGHVESFHGRLREECLRTHWFKNLFDARVKIAGWKTEYNEVRPHGSLDYRTPSEFARVCQQPRVVELENSYGVPQLHNALTFS